MAALGTKLRSVGTPPASGIAHWCPACDAPHVIWIERAGHVWTWDGNVERPTIQPSVRCFTTYEEDGETVLPNGGQRTLCHYFITAGSIDYCADCPHSLSGKRVPLPDFPVGK